MVRVFRSEASGICMTNCSRKGLPARQEGQLASAGPVPVSGSGPLTNPLTFGAFPVLISRLLEVGPAAAGVGAGGEPAVPGRLLGIVPRLQGSRPIGQLQAVLTAPATFHVPQSKQN